MHVAMSRRVVTLFVGVDIGSAKELVGHHIGLDVDHAVSPRCMGGVPP